MGGRGVVVISLTSGTGARRISIAPELPPRRPEARQEDHGRSARGREVVNPPSTRPNHSSGRDGINQRFGPPPGQTGLFARSGHPAGAPDAAIASAMEMVEFHFAATK